MTKTNEPFKTIIVEDEALIRRNLSKKITDYHPSFQVVGEAMNGEEALKLVEAEVPHFVMTDIEMPLMNGLELTKTLFFAYPHIKIVIISGYNEFEYARQAITYKVEDYLLKPVTNEQLQLVLGKIELQLRKEADSLGHIASTMNDRFSQEEIVNTILHYLKENYNKDLSLSEIAGYYNFSVDYLGKVFKKYTKETPIKYITRLRINEAKRILSTHVDVDIQTVGKLVGYRDPYYFSRVFKNNTGHYPSEYRALYQQKHR